MFNMCLKCTWSQECVIDGLNGDALGGRGPLVESPGNPDFLALTCPDLRASGP